LGRNTVPGHGVFAAVVGPSGAGKDTLIDYARKELRAREDVLFVRRIITREADSGSEDHGTLDRDAFAASVADGHFAVHWEAHGLQYGIPVDALKHVNEGGMAVANCSRRALNLVMEVFPAVKILFVTAQPSVLADRLAARGREKRSDIVKRLSRSVPAFAGSDNAVVIDNSGLLSEAQDRFIAALNRIIGDGE
jgi:ribose 1,5-bisphosphokinase